MEPLQVECFHCGGLISQKYDIYSKTVEEKRLRGNQPSTINLYETNLSSLDNLSDTICCGPWIAACSQYSFTCVRICLNILTILLIIKKAIPPQNFVSQIPVRMNAHFVNVRNIELYENIFYQGHQNNIFLGEAPKISALQISKFCLVCSPKIF